MKLALLFALLANVLPSNARYDAKIPALKQVVGHDYGDEITTPDQIATYLKALASAAPERVRLIEYARSWENRPLHVLVIGSPDRIARLDQVKADLRKIADPRTTPVSESTKLISSLPVVVWLMHAVHGNEISSSEAAMAEAYHLLASQGDPAVDSILQNALVLIDPLQNPDGRSRFITDTLLGRAAAPDAEPAAAEHDEPWPGGRSNHYLFDMNRDWFAQTQPETRGRTKTYLEFFPQVVVDLHEMGGESSYYFAPPADPLNPLITRQQARWFQVFGKENARRFDEKGFSFFTREVFDSFYPGYGESWPIFQGAIGMTYEEASTRGLVYRRQDESLLTYRDAVAHHFTAALATLETAARNREQILRDFADYRRSAMQDGDAPAGDYLVPPGCDPSRTNRLVQLLVNQGFEARRTDEPVKVGDANLPAGTFIIPLMQPSGRLLRNLMERHVPQPEAFVKEQERRRKKRLPDQIYDMTAWSLPEVFDVEVVFSAEARAGRGRPPSPGQPRPRRPKLPLRRSGYLMPWGSGSAGAVVEALQKGIRVRSAGRPFTLGEANTSRARQWSASLRTARMSRGRSPRSRLRTAPKLVPIDSSFVDEGISLGSNEVVPLKAPRVLLAWDSPTQSASAGWARYTLERRWEQPATAVRLSAPREDRHAPLRRRRAAFGKLLQRALRRRAAAAEGLGPRPGAPSYASGRPHAGPRENVGLLDTRTELRTGAPMSSRPRKTRRKPSPPRKPFDLEKAILPDRERPDAVPGAIVTVVLDPGTLALRRHRRRNTGHRRQSARIHAAQAGQGAQRRGLRQARQTRGRRPRLGRSAGLACAEGIPDGSAPGAGTSSLSRRTPTTGVSPETTELLFINAVLLGPAH